MREKVYAYLKTVPEGRVVTYGQIASALGNKNLARAVGNILHQNPDPQNIPCHRVVNRKGELSDAYAFGGREAQRARLEEEGIVFRGNGTVDIGKYGMA
ncbi:MAG: MGMT family protein [Oscillospiraceae bacterium]|nr:MGMT family protein [Oscillospiraceae bacterium]